MKIWVEEPSFKALKIGCVIDEGIASPDNSMILFYGERAPWWVKIKAKGSVGHGSRFIENTAVLKLLGMLNQLSDFRENEKEKLHRQKELTLGDVTTLNITNLQGGVGQPNVIPSEMEAVVDIRIPPSVDLKKFDTLLNSWAKNHDVELEYINKSLVNPESPHSNKDSWWSTIQRTLNDQGIEIQPRIFPAATDSRFIRHSGIPAYGFSPIKNTQVLMHDHDEHLSQSIFLEGIEIFVHLMVSLSNQI